MKSSSTRMAPVALAFFLTVAGASIAASRVKIDQQWLASLESLTESVCLRLTYYVIPPLLVAAALYTLKRNSQIFSGAITAVGINGVARVIRVFVVKSQYTRASLFDYVVDISQMLTNPWYVIAVMVVLQFHFRGKLDRLRVVALALIAANVAISVAGYWARGTLFDLLAVTVHAANVVILSACTWCLLFRRHDRPNRPPIDSARVIALTCPRCQTAQEIPAGHGECGSCRLQITISLEEGVCGNCRYPLRGLTGDKCPECGTDMAWRPSPQAQAENAQAAQTNAGTISP